MVNKLLVICCLLSLISSGVLCLNEESTEEHSDEERPFSKDLEEIDGYSDEVDNDDGTFDDLLWTSDDESKSLGRTEDEHQEEKRQLRRQDEMFSGEEIDDNDEDDELQQILSTRKEDGTIERRGADEERQQEQRSRMGDPYGRYKLSIGKVLEYEGDQEETVEGTGGKEAKSLEEEEEEEDEKEEVKAIEKTRQGVDKEGQDKGVQKLNEGKEVKPLDRTRQRVVDTERQDNGNEEDNEEGKDVVDKSPSKKKKKPVKLAPLLLTPYIESGKLKEGRKKAKVKPLCGKVKSYSGLITVNKRFNSTTFFWYFESERDAASAPLLVWLQGGPGASSLYGLFAENGPYVINANGKVTKRATYWSQRFNVIFIDNPVGTGFSYTDEGGYARNQTVVGHDLYSFITQFLTLFPALRANDFYITGESYAGKYVPAFAHRVHNENARKTDDKEKVNLKGLFIGNGWSDPVHMLKYSDYLFELGLIDDAARLKMRKIERYATKKIKQKKWRQANAAIDYIVGDEGTLYFNYTGLTSYYNYYDVSSGGWYGYHDRFVNSTAFRRAVHVGTLPYHEGGHVYENLYEDVPKSVVSWIVELLDHYPVVFYNGQLDVICAYPLTENALRSMRWKGRRQYARAERKVYKVDGRVAGYYKRVGNLTEILIRDAGHMVPTDQPVWALQMLVDHIYKTGSLE